MSAQTSAELKRQVYDHGNPTDSEQLMLEYINRARANPPAEAARLGIGLNDGLIPGTISTSAKPPLAFHPLLIKSARAHSQWMLDSDTFSHIGIGGKDFTTRMRDAGFVFSGVMSSGENIAWGGSTGSIDLTRETIARHDALFRSPGHRQNLCSLEFIHLGLGIRSGIYKNFNGVMATQDFARSEAYPSTLVLGVVFKDADGDGFYDPGEGVAGIHVSPDNEPWKAVTSKSGGYAVPCSGNSGNLIVNFSGGSLTRSMSRSIPKTGNNLKLDLMIPKTPEIAVEQPAGTNLADGRAKKSFGTVHLKSASQSKVFTIRNSGTAKLKGIAITKAGDHAKDFIVTKPSKTSLGAGEVTTFKVSFEPTAAGKRNASIRIKSNDADENPFNISFTGMGAKH